MLSLTKADFVEALPFSVMIEEAQIQPFVKLALTLDLVPLLGHAVLEAVGLLPAAVLQEYVPGLAATAGDYFVRYEGVYRCLVNGASATTVPTDGRSTGAWQYEPLLTLWTSYLQPYWVRAAFSRFLAQHGNELTKAGITQPNDPQGTFVRAPSSDRASLQAAADSTANALHAKLTAFLHQQTQAHRTDSATGYGYDYAPVGCEVPSRPQTSLRGINSPRRPRR
ncbi:MAG: hypothetical protein ACRYFX_09895 [Janthinobacterium lividum]